MINTRLTGIIILIIGIGVFATGSVMQLTEAQIGQYYDAQFKSQTVPDSVNPGESFNATIQIFSPRSDPASWTVEHEGGTVASGSISSSNWTLLSGGTAPTYIYSKQINVKAPQETGTYHMVIKVTQGSDSWSGGKYGTFEVVSDTVKYSLEINVNPQGAGTTDPSVGSHSYKSNTTVEVTATEKAGYEFSSWGGDYYSSDRTIQVYMSSDKDITAQFNEIPGEKYTINTSVEPSNAGVISLSEEGPYTEGTSVEAQVEPSEGYEFVQWSGDISGTQNPAVIEMDGNKDITAHFTEVGENQFTLTTSVSSGNGTIEPTDGTFNAGESITLEATPDSGYVFAGWGGDISGDENPKTITVNSSLNVTADFQEVGTEQVVLTIKTYPNDGGSVNVSQSKQIAVNKNTTITVQAYPNEGYAFDSWTGDVQSQDKTTQVYMNADKTITANFKEEGILMGLNLTMMLMILGGILALVGVIVGWGPWK